MTGPIDPRALEALRRDRDAPAPDAARARVASRLSVLGPRPDPPPRGESAARAVTGSTQAGLLAIAFVAGGVAGALLHAGLSRAAAPRLVYIDRPTPSIPSVAMPSAAATRPSAAGSALEPSPPSSASISTGPPSSPPPSGLAQMDAERSLLDAARIALVGGDSDTALHALDRHARTYSHPLLGEERDALLVQALVRAGRYDEARSRAEAFRRRVPKSLFLPAVDAAIASIP
jgi:hypothetical protein